MADLDIRQDFIEGVAEVFGTLFNDGITSGVYYYAYKEDTLNIYKENRKRQFYPPVLLIAKVELTPEKGDTDIEELKNAGFITIPLKSFMDNNLDVSSKGLKDMKRGYLYFDGIFYEIINIRPQAFVENVFLTYKFTCLEDVEMKRVFISYESEETGGVSVAEYEDDR